jgi:hypothetical protein
VEPELRLLPPRTIAWKVRDGSPYRGSHLADLARHRAVKGWVAFVEVDRSDPEGPDFRIRGAYEDAAGSVARWRLSVGYDAYHWAVGSPEHHDWFMRTMRAGSPLTLLVSPDGKRVVPFGQCEAFVERAGRLVWAAE